MVDERLFNSMNYVRLTRYWGERYEAGLIKSLFSMLVQNSEALRR